MTDIKLNFINQSNDQNNSEIVIFQKNESSIDEIAFAWTVIKNCGLGDNHPFVYPMQTYVGASDKWGNYTPHLPAQPGQFFEMILTTSGDTLVYKGPATSSKEIQIANYLSQGAINALIFKDGKLLASKTNVAPGQKAVFEFKPTIFIGVASEIEQGQVMNSAILSEINTELSLLGIASADIVMTGGGTGPDAKPFTFTLQNVEME